MEKSLEHNTETMFGYPTTQRTDKLCRRHNNGLTYAMRNIDNLFFATIFPQPRNNNSFGSDGGGNCMHVHIHGNGRKIMFYFISMDCFSELLLCDKLWSNIIAFPIDFGLWWSKWIIAVKGVCWTAPILGWDTILEKKSSVINDTL